MYRLTRPLCWTSDFIDQRNRLAAINKAFKPIYESDIAIFNLHCAEQTFRHVTIASEMASIAEKVVMKLSRGQTENFWALRFEEVSDSEDGTALKITEPLKWLSQTSEEGPQINEPGDAVVESRLPARPQPVEVVELSKQNEVKDVMKGFKAQIRELRDEVTTNSA